MGRNSYSFLGTSRLQFENLDRMIGRCFGDFFFLWLRQREGAKDSICPRNASQHGAEGVTLPRILSSLHLDLNCTTAPCLPAVQEAGELSWNQSQPVTYHVLAVSMLYGSLFKNPVCPPDYAFNWEPSDQVPESWDERHQ